MTIITRTKAYLARIRCGASRLRIPDKLINNDSHTSDRYFYGVGFGNFIFHWAN